MNLLDNIMESLMNPNKHTFTIHISDGHCQFKYTLTPENGKNLSIRDIYLSLCKTYKTTPKEGTHCPIEKNNPPIEKNNPNE